MYTSCITCIHRDRSKYIPKGHRTYDVWSHDVCAVQQYKPCKELPPAHSCEFYTRQRGWLRRLMDWIW